MYYNKNFDRNKIKRFVERYGKEFTFKHFLVDEYGERKKDEEPLEIKITGVFHEVNSYITENVQDGTISRRKPQPMILVLATENFEVTHGDVVTYCNTDYEVVETLNVNNLGVAFDISLQVVDDGTGFGLRSSES